jgi:lipopolysaccharide transport system ATP-binding protein
MRPIIIVENLGKCYRVGGLDPGYATLREMLASSLTSPFRRLSGRRAGENQVWALRGLNFEVTPGDTVGLIGHNGAGKSTLLKMLSRITVPTTGRTRVYGRIGSLLEVGTGFHPDLTGRENVYLNGAILGLRRAEIARKFDQIVAFSELERFIDTPVKFYSSGMYLRLAFSVASHLDTEVLFMDEVLAVGDIAFQQKCLNKMHEIRGEGRTILFVSHSMAAVTRLCRRVIWLDGGCVVRDGDASQVASEYLGKSLKVMADREWGVGEAPGSEAVRLRRVRIRDEAGSTVDAADIRSPVGVELTYEVLYDKIVLTPKVEIFNEDGTQVFATHDVGAEWRYRPRPPGLYLSTVWVPGNYFAEGNLFVHASLVTYTPATAFHAHVSNAAGFRVVDNLHKDSARGDLVGPIPGIVRPLLNWETSFLGSKDAFVSPTDSPLL